MVHIAIIDVVDTHAVRPGGTMQSPKYTTRRSVLRAIGAGSVIAVGTGTVTASGHRDVEPTFFARLSDNPSIAGHEKAGSRGRGRLDLRGETTTEPTALAFELSVANVREDQVAIRIRGNGTADGPIWTTLYEGSSSDGRTVTGTITDGDLDGVADVSTLIWDELVDGNGVVTVDTGIGTASVIAGVIRPRPVAGWIAV